MTCSYTVTLYVIYLTQIFIIIVVILTTEFRHRSMTPGIRNTACGILEFFFFFKSSSETQRDFHHVASNSEQADSDNR